MTIISPSVKRVGLRLALCSLLLTLLPAGGLLAGDSSLPPGKQVKLVLARQSTADSIEIMKHLSQSCPNITLITNLRNSDYMLYAGGWSGDYRFMVIRKGGETIYATQTVLLSNAVKNVCRFLDTR
jgi:hypothetical protein